MATKKIEIPLESLVAAEESGLKRHELRNRIKRAYDRMMFVKVPFADTKMLRGSTSSDGYFRSQGGFRR